MGDLSKEENCRELIDGVVKKYNRIDLLILNAGINAHFYFSELDKMEVFDQLMKTNLYANIYLTKYALPSLRKF